LIFRQLGEIEAGIEPNLIMLGSGAVKKIPQRAKIAGELLGG
jgi:hypothetical protein